LCSVVGLDNLNDYYEVSLKHARLANLDKFVEAGLFTFVKIDLADRVAIANTFCNEKFDRVIHLAAQAGVRYSIENPMAYADSNLIVHLTILEGCRHDNVKHLVYASSSVYGLNSKVPFATSDTVDHPVSLMQRPKNLMNLRILSNANCIHTITPNYEIF